MQPASSSSSNAPTADFPPLTAAEEMEIVDTIHPPKPKEDGWGLGMRFKRLPLREYFHRHRYHHYNSKNSSLDRPQ